MVGIQCASAIEWADYTIDECILDTNTPLEIDKCVSYQYENIDERLNRVYKQLVDSLPESNKTDLKQKQRQWIKDRDKLCYKKEDEFSKAMDCYIKETMQKITELSELDKQVNKHKFEGKWEHSFKSYDGATPIHTSYFLIENGENICGTWSDATDNKLRGRALFRAEDSLYARSIKICGYRYVSCENEGGANNKAVDSAFANWDANNNHVISAVPSEQDIYLRKKTPLSKKEKDKLIKDNKWLQDCLNYKGE